MLKLNRVAIVSGLAVTGAMHKRIARRIALVAASMTAIALFVAAPALAAYPAPHHPGQTHCLRFFNPIADTTQWLSPSSLAIPITGQATDGGSTHFPGEMWTNYSIYALNLVPIADGEMQFVGISTVLQRWSGASWVNDVVHDLWVGYAYDFQQPIYWYDRYWNRMTGESGGYQVFQINRPGIYRIAVHFFWNANSTGSPAGSDYLTNNETCTY
jgi:hypothetical protein